MNILVLIKLVPDLVEELEINASHTALDTTWLRRIINEPDDHAIEQAILLKERGEATVTIVAPDIEGIDEVLFTAAAKGADRLIKLTGDFEAGLNNHALARLFASLAKSLQPDLILTGVQAHDDLDGSVGALVAGYLDMPYTGYICGVTLSETTALGRKEYPGGLIAEMSMKLPAVLGIQSSEQPPRYVAVSKVRQVMRTAQIETRPIEQPDFSGGTVVARMFQPETTGRATMLAGSEDEIAVRIVELLTQSGVI